MTDDEIRAIYRAKAIVVVADAIDQLLDNLVANEAQAIAAVNIVAARRIVKTARDRDGAQAGAVMAAKIIGGAAAELMKVKLHGQ